jgi:sugar phosphate isomerase/epimerase
VKRSVLTDEISQSFDRAVDLAREFSLDGLDVRTVWEKRIDLLDDDELARLKLAAGDAGLAIPSIAPPFLKCNLDEWPEHRRVLERSLRAAEKLGARVVRGFTFWKGAATFEQIVDAYREVAPTIERAGLVVGIENEASCVIGTTERLPELLDAIGSPAVWALWDPANGAHDGERAYPDAFARIVDQTVHVHLKDGRHVGGKWEHAIVGEGEVGVVDVLRALRDSPYDGWVALETHYRPQPTGADLTRPGGSALSELGEEGTRACLLGWNRALRAL